MPRPSRPSSDRVSPLPPPGFRPPKDKRFRRNRPRRSQLIALAPAAEQLRAAQGYRADFGSYVPDPNAFANVLEAADRWAIELGAAQRWLAYVEEQDAFAWTAVLDMLRVFSPAFLIAAKHATVARRYSALAYLIGARRKPRKRKAAKKAKAKTPAT